MYVLKQNSFYYVGDISFRLSQKSAAKFIHKKDAVKRLKELKINSWAKNVRLVKLKKKIYPKPKENTVFLYGDKPHIITQVIHSSIFEYIIYVVDSFCNESLYRLKEYNSLLKNKSIKVIWEPN